MPVPQADAFEILARTPDLVSAYRDRYEPLLSAPLSEIVRIEDPAFHVNPWPIYERLQQESPAFWYERYRTWILTRHQDVRFVARSPDTF